MEMEMFFVMTVFGVTLNIGWQGEDKKRNKR